MKQVTRESITNSVLFATSKLEVWARKMIKKKKERKRLGTRGKGRDGLKESYMGEWQRSSLCLWCIEPSTWPSISIRAHKMMPHCREKNHCLCRLHLGLKKGQVTPGKITFHLQSASYLWQLPTMPSLAITTWSLAPWHGRLPSANLSKKTKPLPSHTESQPCISTGSTLGFII